VVPKQRYGAWFPLCFALKLYCNCDKEEKKKSSKVVMVKCTFQAQGQTSVMGIPNFSISSCLGSL
jgi:hypothetical protein